MTPMDSLGRLIGYLTQRGVPDRLQADLAAAVDWHPGWFGQDGASGAMRDVELSVEARDPEWIAGHDAALDGWPIEHNPFGVPGRRPQPQANEQWVRGWCAGRDEADGWEGGA